MIWKKFEIETTTKDFELVSAVLMEHGICDIQIENNVQLTDEELNQMYADFVKELPEDDGTCTVNFYLDENLCVPGEALGTGDSPSVLQGEKIDLNALKESLQEASELFGIQPVILKESEVDTQDWENKWKEYFKPFEVDGIIIKPTWEEVPDDAEGKVVLNIDPGMAFGTGLHETTRLCLQGLKKYMQKGQAVLDLGCGSGILSIAALKLGASTVTAVDIDEQAVKVAYENFELNTAEDEFDSEGVIFQLNVGDVTEDGNLINRLAEHPYDIVLANILAEVIVKLIPKADLFMKKGAYLITSGILLEKEQLVVDAVAENEQLEYVESKYDGDWASVIIRRK